MDRPVDPDLAASGPPTLVVGVGASAGGLEALEKFFDGVATIKNVAFVVVTHLSPDYRSLLDELLARRTSMPVCVADDGAAIESGHVYVLPPRKDMIVAGERLFLRDRDTQYSPPTPIDTFFHSLAREWGSNAVGVVLSGTGSDGSRGVVDIKRAGGYVIVQSPDTARFAGMPEAAMDTGGVDSALPPAEIGQVIARLTKERESPPIVTLSDDAEAAAMERVVLAALGVSDIDFSHYKTSTLRRRVERRMNAAGAKTVADYADLVERDQEEARHLSDDLLIGVTDFFRDSDAFDRLMQSDFENLVAKRVEDGTPVRIWCAGCATGQEAYTIAMLIHDLGRRLNKQVIAQIFATDIRDSFLERASRGLYTADEIKNVPPEFARRYFTATDTGFQIAKSLRHWVVFAHHDLLKSPPFTKVDLIICRNVLIYFDTESQSRIFALFQFALNPSGVLFLGPSETLGEAEREFLTLDSRWRIFQKTVNRPMVLGPSPQGVPAGAARMRAGPTPSRVAARRRESDLLPAYSAMLEKFAPPSALVSADRELLHTFGDARRYLHPPSGIANLDVINMVDSGLRTPLATGIDRCLREHQEIVFPDLLLRDDASGGAVELHILPLSEVVSGVLESVLVLFSPREREPRDAAAKVVDLTTEEISNRRVEELELELKRTRETLQATIEEVETSNEELQSSNEEMMAANEELQSTNEELNSVNEELYSVNGEYQRQNEELVGLNKDMDSILMATDIGVVLVTETLLIRRFTSISSRLFNIISDDIGRSLDHLAHNLMDFDPAAFIRKALSTREPQEVEVLSRGGDWWMMRCVPHYAAGGGDGAVLTAVSINRLKSAERRAALDEQRYRRIATLAGAVMFDLNADGVIDADQPDWERFTGQTRDAYERDGWLQSVHLQHRANLASAFETAIADKSELDATFRLWSAAHQEWRHVHGVIAPLYDDRGAVTLWNAVVVDIESSAQAETLFRESEVLLQNVAAASPIAIAYFNADRRLLYANEAYRRVLDVDLDAAIGKTFEEITPPDALLVAALHIDRALSGERGVYFWDRKTESGTPQVLSVAYAPHLDADGAVVGFGVNVQDVMELRAEDQRRSGLREIVTRAIDEHGNEALLFDSETLKIRHASLAAQRRLGYALDELTTMRIDALTPTIRPDKWRELVGQASLGAQRVKVEAIMLQRSGAIYDCDIECAFVRDDEESYGVAIAIDISDRLDVARSLRERTAELAASNRDLEQFASAASHDLRAPLNQVSNFISIVLDDFDEALPAEAKSNLKIAFERTERLQDMVTSLLEYSRLNAMKRPFEEVDLNHVLAHVQGSIAPSLREVSGQVVVGALPTVRGDAILLDRLFQNLLENAVKYRGDQPLEIRVDDVSDDERSRIAVTDNGRGVPPEFSGKVFEIFTQLRPPRESGGVGLGLSICRRIMEIHDGRIDLDGRHEGGARFVVEFAPTPQRATAVEKALAV